MIEDKFYRCIPELNKECKKNNCYINGGECEMTICKQYSLKGLLEENERLNNIIKGLDNTIENLEEVIERKDSIINKAIKKCEENADWINEAEGAYCGLFIEIEDILKEKK